MRALLLLALLAAPAARAQFDELERESAKVPDASDPAVAARRQQDELERVRRELDEQYEDLMRRLERQREELRASVRRQWDQFHESTTKAWVDYSPEADSYSRVDFEKGKVVVETLVPAEEADAGQERLRRAAREKLIEQARRFLSEKDAKGKPVLEGQLAAPGGGPATAADAPKLIAAPALKVDAAPVVGKDGKARVKVRVELDLVPDHLKLRARRHAARVGEAAGKYGLEPELLFAVIHTESEFNPRARSPAPAFGLMQLMANSGAREAYRYLYKEDKILPPDYLYDPDNNILLGATYLHLLRTRHFPKVRSDENRRSLMIAAYNCGPGCVRKNVLAKADPDALSNEELVALIRRSTPAETAAYVPKVQGRMPAYRGL